MSHYSTLPVGLGKASPSEGLVRFIGGGWEYRDGNDPELITLLGLGFKDEGFVVETKSTFLARASLIDRLVDINPRSQWEAKPLRALSREELKESVRRDLEWLLNTRTSFPGILLDKKDLTVIDYGIADFGSYSPTNPDHQKLLAQRITRSISAFEPRLQKVRVTVEPEMPDEKTLTIHLDAVLVVESLSEPVSFRTVLQGQVGRLEIHESI